ncbi:MAG: DNA topoisomerase [Candidatus Hodarchaeales archaeon]|jgi:DNA topoisomerase IA
MPNTTIITEKPSVARKMVTAFRIDQKLDFETKKGKSKYNPIHRTTLPSKLEFSIGDKQLEMTKNDVLTISSVLGHILSFDYDPPFDKKSSWEKTDLFALLELQPREFPDKKYLISQLKDLGSQSDVLVIGTDWDGHGESIGAQIASVATEQRPNLRIGRMRFTSTAVGSLMRAFQTQTTLDQSWIAQVDSLRKQDLRMGATLTRFLTVGVQSQGVPNKLVSYGPCQTSVLWIIADRAREQDEFISKPYWLLIAEVKDKASKKRWSFQWVGGRQYDHSIIAKIYESIKDEEIGTISAITSELETIKRPVPLDTDTLQYDGARYFRTTPKHIADTAEKLYNQGFITYPRTESSYYHEKDLTPLLEKFLPDGPFAELAENVKQKGDPKDPRKGRFTRDHEPIRPVKSASQEEISKAIRGSERDKELAWKIYDYVVRRFFATIHRDGTKESTKMEITVGKEKFESTGTKITEAGFLEVFPFRLPKEALLPKGEIGDTLPVQISIKESKTRPLPLWTDAGLIREMASKNIGTDATRAEHIETVKSRKFAEYSGTRRGLIPTALGQSLYDTLVKTAEDLIRPEIRATVEQWTQKIRSGEMTPDEVDGKVIEITRDGLQAMMASQETIFAALAQAVKETTGEGQLFGHCPECESNIVLHHSRRGKRYLSCENPNCSTAFPLPKRGKLSLLNNLCSWCGLYPIRVGSGTRTWVFCPRCWTALSDEEGPFFCSRCASNVCPYAGQSEQTAQQDRGVMGKCPDCGSDVILTIDGFRTQVICTNEKKCGKKWNAPNLRKGTRITIGQPCETCGMKVLEVKRERKAPYALCVICGKFL